MDLIAHAFHVGKLLVALNAVVFAAALALPRVIYVDVTPAMVDEAGGYHAVGAFQNPFGIHPTAPAIPTIPTHRGSEGDFITDDDAEFFLALAEAAFCAQSHEVFTSVFQNAAEVAGFGVERKSGREVFGRNGY